MLVMKISIAKNQKIQALWVRMIYAMAYGIVMRCVNGP